MEAAKYLRELVEKLILEIEEEYDPRLCEAAAKYILARKLDTYDSREEWPEE